MQRSTSKEPFTGPAAKANRRPRESATLAVVLRILGSSSPERVWNVTYVNLCLLLVHSQPTCGARPK